MVAESYHELLGEMPPNTTTLHDSTTYKDLKANNPRKSYSTGSYGVPYDSERRMRLDGCKHLYNIITNDRHGPGKQYLIATAIILFHRYFMKHSLINGGNYKDKSPVLYFIASVLTNKKVDPRRIISNACHIRKPGNSEYHNEKNYTLMVDELLKNEKKIRDNSGMAMDIPLPHTVILDLIQKIEKEKMANIRLVATAFRMATDILIVTDWTVRYNHVAIAAACVELAAFFLDVKIDDICSEKYVQNWYNVFDTKLNGSIVNAMVKEFFDEFCKNQSMHIGSLRGIDIHNKLTFGCDVVRPKPRQDLLKTIQPPKSAGIFALFGQFLGSPLKVQDNVGMTENKEKLIELFDDVDVSTRSAFNYQSDLYDKPNPRYYINWVNPYAFDRPIFRNHSEENQLRRCRSETELIDEHQVASPAPPLQRSVSMTDIEAYSHSLSNGAVNPVVTEIRARKSAETARKICIRNKQQAEFRRYLALREEKTEERKVKLQQNRDKYTKLGAKFAEQERALRPRRVIENRSFDSTYLPQVTTQPEASVEFKIGKLRDVSNDHLYAPTVSLSSDLKLLLKREKLPMIVPEDQVSEQTPRIKRIIAAARARRGDVGGNEPIAEGSATSSAAPEDETLKNAPTQCRTDAFTEAHIRCCSRFFTSAPGNLLVEQASHISNTDKKKPAVSYLQIVMDAPVYILNQLEFIAKDLTRGKRFGLNDTSLVLENGVQAEDRDEVDYAPPLTTLAQQQLNPLFNNQGSTNRQPMDPSLIWFPGITHTSQLSVVSGVISPQSTRGDIPDQVFIEEWDRIMATVQEEQQAEKLAIYTMMEESAEIAARAKENFFGGMDEVDSSNRRMPIAKHRNPLKRKNDQTILAHEMESRRDKDFRGKIFSLHLSSFKAVADSKFVRAHKVYKKQLEYNELMAANEIASLKLVGGPIQMFTPLLFNPYCESAGMGDMDMGVDQN